MPQRLTGDRVRPSVLSFLRDPANLLTLAGLVCGVLAISFSARGAFTAASTALLWALFCDWFDGPLARRTSHRTDHDRAVGAQLDSLADVVSSGVAPAILLLCIGSFEPWFFPGAVMLVVAGAMRLAHFNVFGHDDKGGYTGLPIDTNIIVVPAIFPFRELIGHVPFSWILNGVIVTLAILNVSPFRMPKLGGGWYYAIFVYVVAMTLINVRVLAS